MAARRPLNGTAKNDQLSAKFAADIKGLDGNDLLTGSPFDDQIFGGNGSDKILAGVGRDLLDGGAGHDDVQGQDGADTFVHRIAESRGFNDRYSGGNGLDTLRLIGSIETYFSSSVQALAGIKGDALRLEGLTGVGIETIEFELSDAVRLNLKTDSAVTAKTDSLRQTTQTPGRVEILRNDLVPDLVRSVSLLTPLAGVSLEFQRDPTVGGGQRAVLVFNPGNRLSALPLGTTRIETAVVRITDADGDTATSKVTVTMEGRAQIPGRIGGTATGALVDDSSPGTASGVLTVTDPNPGDSRFRTPAAADLQGEFGSFSFNATTGAWSFTADPARLQPLKAGEVATESLTVTSADGLTRQDVVVSLTGRNDPAVLKDAGGTIQADAADPLRGRLTVTDADRGEARITSFAGAVAGSYGSFTLLDQGDGTATWSYLLNTQSADVRKLGPGETLKDVVTVTSLDQTKLPLGVTITGVNDAPTGNVVVTGTLQVGSVLKVGAGSLADAEGLGTLRFQWLRDGKAISGATRDSYTLSSEDAGKDISVQTSYTDGKGTAERVTTKAGTVGTPGRISGTATGSLVEDSSPGTASGVLTVTDPNPGEAGFKAPAAGDLLGEYGSFSFNANTGAWSFTADPARLQPLKAGEVATESLTVTSADGLTRQDIVVSLTGRNDPAALKDAGGTILGNAPAPLKGRLTVTDADRGEARIESFVGAVAGDYGSFTLLDQGDGTATWSYLLNTQSADVRKLGPGETLKDVVTVTSLDQTKLPLGVTITGVNDAPTGNVAITGTLEVGNVLKVGAGSLADAEGLGTLSFQWLRDGKAISGATGDSYTLTFEDAGKDIAVQTSYTDGKGTAERLTTKADKAGSADLQVTTLQDVVDADDGLTSLREAIANAATKSGADEIRFAAGLTGEIHLTSQLEIETGNDVSIFGEGRITIDANADGNDTAEFTVSDTTTLSRAVLIDGATVTLDGLTFTGGREKDGGAILVKSGTATITDSRFIANAAERDGGAFYAISGTPTLTDSWFEGNTALGNGGAVANATITGSTFKNNSAGFGFGGAITNSVVSTSSFVGNAAFGGGGAAFSTITQSSFVDNRIVDPSGYGPDAFEGSVHNSLLLSVFDYIYFSNVGGNIIIGQQVRDWSEALASNKVDEANPHLLLKVNALNPALDLIADPTGLDAFGTAAVDQPAIGKADQTRDAGAVELSLVAGPQPAGIGGNLSRTITEDAASSSGKAIVGDFNAGEAVFKAATDLQGDYGSFTFKSETGHWDYVPVTEDLQKMGPQDSVTDTLAIMSLDGTSKVITVTITGVNDAPTGDLALAGVALVGETLTVTKGTLDDVEAVGTVSFQWLRNGEDIPGATKDSFTLGLADANTEISVRASYTDGKGTAESLISTAKTVGSPDLLVTTLSDESPPTDGLTSLREAIAYAAGKPGADEIRVHADLKGVIHLLSAQLEISAGNAVSIFGDGRITIDANVDKNNTVETAVPTSGSRRALEVKGADVTLDGLTFTGGRADQGGAILVTGGSVTINDSSFNANFAVVKGGAVSGAVETVTIAKSWFEGNRASEEAGAVYAGTISGSTFKDNWSFLEGGAVSRSTVATSSFVGNSAASYGGAAINSTITQSSFVGNTAGSGGADVSGDDIVSNSLLLSEAYPLGNGNIVRQQVTHWSEVLASNSVNAQNRHLRLKDDGYNPAFDRIDDDFGLDALGNAPVDLQGIGLEGLERDVGAVEVLSLVI